MLYNVSKNIILYNKYIFTNIASNKDICDKLYHFN